MFFPKKVYLFAGSVTVERTRGNPESIYSHDHPEAADDAAARMAAVLGGR